MAAIAASVAVTLMAGANAEAAAEVVKADTTPVAVAQSLDATGTLGTVTPDADRSGAPQFSPGNEQNLLRPQFIPPENAPLVHERRRDLVGAAALDGAAKGAALGALAGSVVAGTTGLVSGALIGGGVGAPIGGIGGGFIMGPLGTLAGGLTGMGVGCLVGLPALLIGCPIGAVIGGAIGGVAGGLTGMGVGIAGGLAAGTAVGAGIGAPIGGAIGVPVGAAVAGAAGAAIGAAVAASDANVELAQQNLRDLESWTSNIRLPQIEVPEVPVLEINR